MEIDVEYMAKLDLVIASLYKAGATHVAVTGGAIRDMLFNKPIKDIDVYYTGELDTKELKLCYEKVVECDVKYEDNEFTITHEVKSTPNFPCWIQLIQIEDNIPSIIAKFPSAVGRAFYDGEVLENITVELMQAKKTKTIWFDKPCNMKYYMKYKEKYSDYQLKFLSSEFAPKELNEQSESLDF